MSDYKQNLLTLINCTTLESEITGKEWALISKIPKLSEEFIREFRDKVAWYYISEHQNLSEDFIREFQDYVDWDFISKNETLSEDFIREFKDKIEWPFISRYQLLSDDFLIEFKERIYWDGYMSNQFASFFIIKKFISKLKRHNINCINKEHLSTKQKIELEKIISLINMFKT
jgi:hypothetical protein